MSKKNILGVRMVKQKVIRDWYDIMSLDIIDWDRLNGSWPNSGDALKTIISWFSGNARYMIIRCDLRNAPERNDWPGWEHSGEHSYLGRLFWNTFYRAQLGKLIFSDEPDFFGVLAFPGSKKEVKFFGDINKVSVQTFGIVQKKMGKHDLWISVMGYQRLVIIESLVDVQKTWETLIGIE